MNIRNLFIVIAILVVSIILSIILTSCVKKEEQPKKNETVVEPGQVDYSEDPMFVYQRIGGTADEFRHWFEETSLRIEELPKEYGMVQAPLGIRWKDGNGTYLATYFLNEDEIITSIKKEAIYINGDSESAYRAAYESWYISLKQQGFIDINAPTSSETYGVVYFKHSMQIRGGKHTASLLLKWEDTTNAGYLEQLIELP